MIVLAVEGFGQPAVVLPNNPGAADTIDENLVAVEKWIAAAVPECVGEPARLAAQAFLDEMRNGAPEKLGRLVTNGSIAEEFAPELLRFSSQQLKGPAQASVRESLARRRLELMLVANGTGAASAAKDAAAVLERFKASSPYVHRRILEGRVDGEELTALMVKQRQSKTDAVKTPAKIKERSVNEILSEFSRRNQQGSALSRMLSYSAEATLKNADGSEQRLRIFRLRPNFFRLHVISDGLTKQTLASDGQRVWQQNGEGRVQFIAKSAMGARKYLEEFSNPLFADEGYEFSRLEDGQLDGKKIHRLSVQRADGSRYVACIDTDNYMEIGREYDGGIQSRHNDFRDVAGVKMAFREETTDRDGRKTVFVVDKLVPNPGLLSEFFSPPTNASSSHLLVERLSASTQASVKIEP